MATIGTEQMTGLERVVSALQHKEGDRVPAAPLFLGGARRVLGVTHQEWSTDPELTAEGMIQTTKLVGQDAICCAMDLSVEAADFGQEIKFPIEDTPQAVYKNPLIKSPEDYARLKRVDPRKTDRMSKNLRYLERVVQALGKEKAVLGFFYEPLGVLSMMRSAERLFLDCMKCPEKVIEGLEIVTDVMLDYVDAQIERGPAGIAMDTLFASGSIMSRELWMKLEAPFVRKIAEKIHGAGLAIMVHNCGNNPYFDVQIEVMHPEAISVAYMPNECKTLADFKATWGDKTTIVGLVHPAQVMFMGTPEQVKEACKEEIQALAPGGGFILSTGCEFPPNASLLNAIAMMEAAEEYGRYPIVK
jgi:uroporphyrinogen decarboxylase